MTEEKAPLFAVLTGDLVASRKASLATIERAMEVLQSATDSLAKSENFNPRFTRFRGDGWQILLTNPNMVLDAVLYLHASLRASKLEIDSRISAGIGSVDSVGTQDLSDATGAAFFVSGDHLDHAKKRRFLIAGRGIGGWQNAVFQLAEEIAFGWSPAQAEAITLMFLGDMTQKDVAGRLGVTRQAIQLRLASAGFSAFDEALYSFRNHDFHLKPERNDD